MTASSTKYPAHFTAPAADLIKKCFFTLFYFPGYLQNVSAAVIALLLSIILT